MLAHQLVYAVTGFFGLNFCNESKSGFIVSPAMNTQQARLDQQWANASFLSRPPFATLPVAQESREILEAIKQGTSALRAAAHVSGGTSVENMKQWLLPMFIAEILLGEDPHLDPRIVTDVAYDLVALGAIFQRRWTGSLSSSSSSSSKSAAAATQPADMDDAAACFLLTGRYLQVQRRVVLKARNISQAWHCMEEQARAGLEEPPHHVLFPRLDTALILQVHKCVARDVVPSTTAAGVFRQTRAGAAKTDVMYAMPETIEHKLHALLSWYNSICDSLEAKCVSDLLPQSGLAEAIKLAAIFFSEFLLIRPFSNGNGRVSRLLVHHILRRFILVPFSLYIPKATWAASRHDYLQILNEAQLYLSVDALCTYFLWSALRQVHRAQNLLTDDKEE